jgi:putative zinc finger protein
MDKDEALDRLLQRTSRARVGSRSAGACLEPETLAAWMDGTLTAPEREAAEAHAADCDRCLSVLAAVARTSPPPSVAEGPRWFSVRWVLPLATAAVAITAWVLVPSSPGPSPAPPSAARVQAPVVQEPRSAPPAASEGDTAKPAERAAEQPATAARADAPARPQAEETQKRLTQEPAPTAARDQAAAAAKPAAVEPPPSVAKESKDQLTDSLSSRQRFEAPADARMGATQGGAPPAPAAPAPSAAPALPQAESPSGRPSEVARSSPTQGPPIPRAAANSGRSAMRITTRPVVDIQSPDGNVRWRIDGPTVSRTSNGGTTWSEQFTGNATPLIGGSSPAPTVCWVVGTRGVVLLSIDGQTWRRLEFPDPAADLVRVIATDANSATVTAADGRVFRTANGGRAWTPQEKPPAPF